MGKDSLSLGFVGKYISQENTDKSYKSTFNNAQKSGQLRGTNNQ